MDFLGVDGLLGVVDFLGVVVVPLAVAVVVLEMSLAFSFVSFINLF